MSIIGRNRALRTLDCSIRYFSKGCRTPIKAYKRLQQRKLEIADFPDNSREQSRSKDQLEKYLEGLKKHCDELKFARPIPPNGEKEEIWKPPYHKLPQKKSQVEKFFERIEVENPELFAEMTKPVDSKADVENPELFAEMTKPVDSKADVDLTFLDIFADKPAPEVMNDEDYPSWVWQLAPENQLYSKTEQIWTPVENLSENERARLWQWWETLKELDDKLYKKTVGYRGDDRPFFDDTFPEPLCARDIWSPSELGYKENYEDPNNLAGYNYQNFNRHEGWSGYIANEECE